jgi:Fe-S-cluster containining protein
MKVDLRIHPSMRFSCTMCGKCCRGWAISFTDEERRRLEAQDWGKRLPDLAGRTLWEPVPGAAGPMTWRFRLREDGACPFLGERNQCRIHEALGAEAKPHTCRMFPFTFADTPAGTFVGLRFNCPGVLGGGGEPVTEGVRELVGLRRELERIATPPRYPDQVAVGARGRLDWDDVRVVEEAALRLLDEGGLPFLKRLLVLLRLAEVFEGARMEALTGERLKQMVALVLPDLKAQERDAALVRPALGAAERALFHQFLAIIYSKEYGVFQRLPFRERLRLRLRAAANGYRFLFGRGRVALSGWAGPIDLSRVWDIPAPATEPRTTALLERWLRWKVWGKSTFSRLYFDLPYEAGLGSLGAMFAGAAWWARASALARGASAAEFEDWERALDLVDGALAGLRRPTFYHRLVVHAVGRPGLAQRLVRWFAAPAPRGVNGS